jgi:hypothetical protein
MIYPSNFVATPTAATGFDAKAIAFGSKQFTHKASANVYSSTWDIQTTSAQSQKPEYLAMARANMMLANCPDMVQAAKFVSGDSTYLTTADHADLYTTGSWYVSAFFLVDASKTGANVGIVSHGTSSTTIQFQIIKDTADKVSFSVTTTGTTLTTVLSSAITLDKWHHVVACYDATALTIKLSVDGGAFTSTAFASTLYNTANAFEIGRYQSGSYLTGQVKQVSYGQDNLIVEQAGHLYNNGQGVTYANYPPALLANLKSFWALDETSTGVGAVTRNDVKSVRHFTDNGTTESITTGGLLITVYGDTTSAFASPETVATRVSTADLLGVDYEDLIIPLSFAATKTYWRIKLETDNAFQHEVSKIFMGSYFDMGVEPVVPMINDSESTARRAAKSFSINFEGMSATKRAEFYSKIVSKLGVGAIFVYAKDGYDEMFGGRTLVYCNIEDIRHQIVTMNNEKFSLLLKEAI